ncbi:TIGR03756 family integrating conjugative element protein [Vibrio vulnificus]
MSCLKWRIAGFCVWYRWPWSIKTTVKVKHYIPDYVISVYENAGDNPWEVMSFIDDLGDVGFKALYGVEAGGGKISAKGRASHSTNVMFKNATAIGNPLASAWQAVGFNFLLCPSAATSFVPAYSSSFDWLAWRTNPIEGALYLPQIALRSSNIAPSSSPLEQWASLYPRTGFVVGTDDLKTAAVAGARAASIVTDTTATFNVVNRPPLKGKRGYWPPKALNIKSNNQGYFQMLLPKEKSSCGLIADIGSPTTLDQYRSTNGNYAWNFWRPYVCCNGRGRLLFHMTF